MTIEEKIHAVLSAAAGVLALIPSERIMVPGDWQNLITTAERRPYIVHLPVAPDPVNTHDTSPATLCGWIYQVSVFATTYPGGRTAADAVRSALTGTHTVSGETVEAIWTGMRHLYEREDGIHHFALEFEAYENLS